MKSDKALDTLSLHPWCCFVELDTDYRITGYCKNLKEVFRLSPGVTLLNRPLKDLGLTIDIEKASPGAPVVRDCKHRDAPARTLEVFVREKEGQDGYLLLIEDVSRHKKALQFQHEIVKAYEVLINLTNDLIWSVDTDKNLVVFNAAYAQALEITTGEAPRAGDPVMNKGFKPERYQRWAGYYERVLAGGSFENVEQTEIGGRVMYVKNSFSPILEDGKVIGASIFAKNITEQTEDKQKLEVAIESGKIGTWFLDLRSGLLTVNNHWAQMLGYSLSDIKPNQYFFFKLIHPEDKIHTEDTLKKIADPNYNKFSFKIRLRCKDGTYKWILDSGMVTRRDNGGAPLVMAGTHIDINEEIELRSEIETERNRLRESQKRGRLGDWTYEKDTGKMTWSDQVYELFEWDKSAPTPSFEELLMFFDESSAQKLTQAVGLAFEKGQPYDFIHSMVANGQQKYIRSIGTPVKDESGRVNSLRGVVQDVTSQVSAEQEKELYLNRLNAIANNIPGAIFQYELKDSGADRMLYVSRGARDLWGYSPDEIMKNNSLVWGQFHESDLGSVQDSIANSAKDLSQWSAEWRNVNQDGSISWLQGRGSPKKVKTAIIWDSIITDITERKNAELSLLEQEAYLRSLYQNAFDGILSCDEEGRIVFFNNKVQDWVGSFPKDLEPADYPSQFGIYTFDQSRLLKPEDFCLIKALRVGSVEYHRFIIKNDSHSKVRYVEANGARITGNEGEILGAVVIIRDITEKIESETALSNAVLDAIDDERTKIASELHDNITQLLGMCKMNLGNLALESPEIGQNKKFLNAKSILAKAIDDTRDLSHAIMPLSIKEFGLVPSIQELLEDLESRTMTRTHFSSNDNLRINRNFEVNLFRTAQEAILNIEKHAKAEEVWVNITFTPNRIEMHIEDNGVGIDHSFSQVRGRTGIGLISMKNRIERAGGSFILESDESGTNIHCQIPLNH